MSVIEEALRRAQEPGQPNTTQPTKADPSRLEPVRLPPHKDVPPATAFAWKTSTFLGLAILFLIGLLVWEVCQLSVRPSRSYPVGAAREDRRAATADRTAATPRPPRHQLELNGIVEGAGEPLAIINGQIVRIGETIDDATLLDIGHTTARLRHHGQEIVLRTTQ